MGMSGATGVGAFANLQDAEGGDGGTPFAAVGDGGAAVASVPQDCDDTSSSDEDGLEILGEPVMRRSGGKGLSTERVRA